MSRVHCPSRRRVLYFTRAMEKEQLVGQQHAAEVKHCAVIDAANSHSRSLGEQLRLSQDELVAARKAEHDRSAYFVS